MQYVGVLNTDGCFHFISKKKKNTCGYSFLYVRKFDYFFDEKIMISSRELLIFDLVLVSLELSLFVMDEEVQV